MPIGRKAGHMGGHPDMSMCWWICLLCLEARPPLFLQFSLGSCNAQFTPVTIQRHCEGLAVEQPVALVERGLALLFTVLLTGVLANSEG